MKTDNEDPQRRTQSDMTHFAPLHEDAIITGSFLCTNMLNIGLDELCVLVAVSDMSQSRREYLVDVIAHLRGHLASDLSGLLWDRQNRDCRAHLNN